MPSRNKPLVIGICGGSGSGKTWLLGLLTRQLGDQCCLISQDHYYRPLQEQQKDELGEVNFDLPSGIDEPRFVRDLKMLRNGKAVQLKEYTFNHPRRSARLLSLEPAPILIVEGLFIFHFEPIRKQLSLKVFIEAKEEIALQRRLKRDQQERAYSEEMIRYQWAAHVRPAYRRYLLPYRETADLIIDNSDDEMPGLQPLIDRIKALQA